MHAIAHVTVGVLSLERALGLWARTFGFEALGRRDGPDVALSRLWGLADDAVVRQALVGTPGVRVGRVHLVEFAQPGPPVRLGAKPVDLCPKNLDVMARDLPRRYEELLSAGQRFRSPWVEYPFERLRVREVQMPSHDETNIVFVELLGAEVPWTAAGYAGISSFVTVVPDPDAEERFYTSLLGLLPLHKHVLRGPEIEAMVGLPPGAGLDVRVLGSPDEAFGRVELVHYQGVAGANLYPRARPPARGALHSSFTVPALPPVRKRALAMGLAVDERGSPGALDGSGPVVAFTTPAGLRVFVREAAGRW
jgi:catechol 2,3-dioxygenase-like lactoylglutathione lyase family enzyme